jgi:DNA replication initiation complex subunit (GINS family)
MADFYTRLLELRRAEAASQALAKVPPDFYGQTLAYLTDLRTTYESELRENPSGRKGDVARQTHGRVLQIARYLVEARTRKILNSAFLVTAGGARDLPNGLPEERALFDRLVGDLVSFREGSAAYLESPKSGGTGGSSPAPTLASPTHGPTSASPPTPRASEVTALPAARTPGPEQVYVRVLRGSPPLEFGGERLELRPEDVLSVAPGLARILIEGQVAEKILAQELPADAGGRASPASSSKA